MEAMWRLYGGLEEALWCSCKPLWKSCGRHVRVLLGPCGGHDEAL